jgi:hypothetical protein
MQLPKGLTLPMLQVKWASILNPLLGNPSNNASVLKNVALVTGTNVVNTLLGRTLQGWSIVRQRGPASFYDMQDTNQSPSLTLVLVSSADVSVDILVF